MRTTHSTRSAVTGLGAAGLLGLMMAGPALADPAPIGAAESTQTSAVTRQGPPSYNHWGSATMPMQGPPSYNSWPAQNVRHAPVVLSTSGIDVDYAQIGVGALGGALVAGAAALVLASSRGRRRAAHA